MSDTGLYLNWNPAAADPNGEKIKGWEEKFEDELSNYERHKNHRYRCGWPRIGFLGSFLCSDWRKWLFLSLVLVLRNGDGFVAAALVGPLSFRVIDLF